MKLLKYLFKRKVLKSILILILIFFLIIKFDRVYSETIVVHAKEKAKLEAELFVNEAIKKFVVPELKSEDLILLESENSRVSRISINTYLTNQILVDITDNLYGYVNNIASNAQITDMKIPISKILIKYMDVNFGPYINYKIIPVGSYTCDINTEVKEYGINSSIITVNLLINIDFQIILPLKEEKITIVTKVPLVMEVIYGEVPNFIYGSFGEILN